MKKLLFYLYFITVLATVSISVKAQKTITPNIPAPQGLAVNTYTGNLFFQRNEQSLRGTGYRIYQSFYYNAATDTLNYGYGRGWSFYYNIFYRESGDSVIIYHADAKKDVFLLQNGIYKSPTGIYDVLTKSGTQITLTAKDGSKHIFAESSHKKVTRIQDKNNNYVSISYTSGFPTKVTNTSGRSLLLTWQNNLLIEAKDESEPAKKYTYQYNSSKDLVSVTDPLNGRKNFSYKNHRIAQVSDQNNSPVVISYYGSGGRVRQITSCNSEQRFTYLANPRKTFVTQKTDIGNVVTGYFFDDNQRLTALTDPEGNQAEFKYDNNSNLIEWKDLKGLITKYEYDSKGNMIKEIDPLGNISEFTYDNTFNNPITIKNKKGAITTLTYNANGNLTSITKPNNTTESYTYDAAGRVLTHKNANNNTTSYQYNSTGDLAKIQYPTGAVLLEYNGSCCNVGKITDPNGGTVEMTYDLLNRVKTVKDKQGNTITNEYDAVGNLIKEKDPVGNVKEYGYDALNRLISVKLPVGTWVYTYDGQNNLTKMTDANGHVTTYEYDKKNRLKKETDPLGNSIQYTYDLNGNLTSKIDPNNNTINYKYDELNRLLEKSYTGNTDKYAYDEEGNLVSAFNNDIAYTFEYDELNRLFKKNILTWNKALSYTYDAMGNRKTMIDHDGGLTTYNYDNNNRLISLTNPSKLTTTFEYDAGGRMKKQINGNKTFTTYHYDTAGRLDSLINWKNNTEKISFFYYTFDQFGNRKTMRDKRGLSTYQYDGSYRLTSVTYPDGKTESFTFDGTGNRKVRTKDGLTTDYTYNEADQIQKAGNIGFAFDANGNTIQQTGTQAKVYKYDAENRLVEVQLASKRKVQFKYDPFGDKIEKVDTLAQITKMLYDDDNLLAEMNGSNATQEAYTTAFGMDTWLSKRMANNDYFFHKDGLNSTVEMTENKSNVVNQYTYDVYGNILTKVGNIDNDILYTSRNFENDIALYDNRNRFYNPSIGRFLNEDTYPIGVSEPMLFNKYNYVASNPTNFIDSDGFIPILPIVVWGYRIYRTGKFISKVYRGYKSIQKIVEKVPQHTNRNCKNDKPTGIPDSKDELEGWRRFSQDESIFHQPNMSLFEAWRTSDNESVKFRYIKYGKANSDGSSSEAIWDTEAKRFLSTGEPGGPSFNYSDPVGAKGKTIHFLLDMLPHFFSDKYTENNCPPPPSQGSDTPIPNTPEGNPFGVAIVNPSDPNEIIGPTGYDSLKWVSSKQNLPFKVLFENDPEFATAPAQNVTVYVPIHPKLNPASLRISDFGFGNFNFTVPQNTSVYTNRLDLRDSLGLYVDVTAGLDIANRRAFWVFQSIDPATGLTSTLPANSGFLPVNDSLKHNGEGYVTFTLIASSLAQTKDSLTAQASIIFDTEETIKTNTWLNILDAVAPTSTISSVTSVDAYTARIKWTGQDDTKGVGIAFYDLYVSKDNGDFQLYQSQIKGNTLDFKGNTSSSYKFYTLATDLVGNKEASKSSSANSIFLGITSPVIASNKPSACTGESINLTATNCTGVVTWSNGKTGNAISVTLTANTNFTANCTINGERSIESDTLKLLWNGSSPTATLTGTQTIVSSNSAKLTVNLTGSSPWSVVINGQTYANITASPYTITVTPTANTTYTLTSVSNACGTVATTTNNSAVVTLTPQTIATSSITGSPFCLGAKVNVAYTATGVIKTGNVFTAQLSNATGSFASGVTTIGTLSSTLSTGTIATTLPSNVTTGTAYRIRVISSSPAINGTDNGVNLAINGQPTATLAGTQTIVSSNSAKLTVNLTGSSPWSVVVNGQTYSNITASPYTITVTPTANTTYTLTSVSNACGTITTNTNNSAVVTLTPQTIATSSITGSPFCLGAKVNVAYTATGVIKTGNVFTAQLSNATGSFATGVTTIGTLSSTLSTGTIATTLPSNATAGTAYRIRVISSSPAINGTDNG
ncbi:RHS repeat-associated core domain-containing protein, partial [Arcicella lustrica]